MHRRRHRGRSRRVAALLCAVALGTAFCDLASTGHARATQAQRATARQYANDGRQLFNQEKYAEAIEKFRAAEELVHAPPHLLYIGRALTQLGRLLEAREAYRQVAEEKLPGTAPVAFQNAQKMATAELAAIDQRIPKVLVSVAGPSADEVTVKIDGVPVASAALDSPLPLDPGEHQVAAEAPGYETANKSLELAAGEGTVEVMLALAHSEARGPAPRPGDEETGGEAGLTVPPFVLLGGGVALLAVGAITGGLALGKADDLKEACPANPCPTTNESLADDANLLATVSTVTFIVGGLAAAAGTAWLIVDLTGTEGESAGPGAVRLHPYLGPGAAGLRGVF